MEKNPYLKGTPEEFIKANEGLIHSVTAKFRWRLASQVGMEYDDLVSIGMEGFIKAYQRFDPSKYEGGVQFSTYAVPMIHGELRRYFREHSEIVRFSRGVKETYFKIVSYDLFDKDVLEIADILEVSEDMIKRALDFGMNRQTNYLDAPIGNSDDGSEICLSDTISYSHDNDTDLILEEFTETLTAKEKGILKAWREGLTQKEIGKVVGLSQVQVSRITTQIEKKAISYGKKEEYDMEREYEPVTKERTVVEEKKTIKPKEAVKPKGESKPKESPNKVGDKRVRADVDKMSALVKDIHLGNTEIAKLTDVTITTASRHRAKYYKTLTKSEVDKCIRELLQTTDMTDKGIAVRLTVDAGRVQDMRDALEASPSPSKGFRHVRMHLPEILECDPQVLKDIEDAKGVLSKPVVDKKSEKMEEIIDFPKKIAEARELSREIDKLLESDKEVEEVMESCEKINEIIESDKEVEEVMESHEVEEAQYLEEAIELGMSSEYGPQFCLKCLDLPIDELSNVIQALRVLGVKTISIDISTLPPTPRFSIRRFVKRTWSKINIFGRR